MRTRRLDSRTRMYPNWVDKLFSIPLFSFKKLLFQSISAALFLLACCLLGNPGTAFGQCNSSGNPSRYEFNINPTTMLNIVGQQFCTSQSMGTNCCGMQPSYRCLDLVFNLANGPMGENFSASCQGLVNLMTANGNFDAVYFNVGTPSAMGGSTNCGAPINIGNNHVISVEFMGNNMGQIEVHLSVTDNMGMNIFNSMQTAMPGEAVIITVCKPGFGCLEDEIIFGCCSADAALSLAPGAPATICSGASSSLKVTGLGGVPPYTVMVKAASTADTTYFPVIVNNDMDGNSSMDMTTILVAPTATTTYSVISVEDGAGCVQPVMGQSATITVNPIPTVFAGNDQTICQNQMAGLAVSLGGGATSGTWSGGSGQFGNPFAPITTYTPAPAEYGTSVELTFTSDDPPGPCPAVSDKLTVTINTLPLVSAGADVMICKNDNLALSKLGASFSANGSGTSSAGWSTSGTGSFLPSNAFITATTYVPTAADRLAGFVTLTLTSGDPPGPCFAVSDQAVLFFHSSNAMVCNDNVMIALDDTGVFCIGPDNILEGDVVDSMFIVEVLVNGVNIGSCIDCSHVGKTLQVRVRDKCSGLYCTGTIVVRDYLPPKLTCTDIELPCIISNLTPDYLKNILGIAAAYPVVKENCPPYTLTYKDTWNDLSCADDFIGYVRRVWTAVDASGNKSSCTQYLNFSQQSISQVLFPPDVVLNCSSGTVNTSPQATGAPYLTAFGLNFPIYPDASYCKLSTTFADNKIKTCDGTFDIIRTWTVYDWCSPTTPMPPSTNPKYYIQIIKVLDNTGPVLNCPADRTVSTDPLACCSTTNLPDMIVSDVCSRIKSALARVEVRHEITGDVIATYDVPGTITNFPGNLPFDPDTLVAFGFTPCLPIGTHTVTYTVTDDCGNTSSCSYSLTVADLVPPVPACDEITQVALGIDGMIFVNATTFDDGSYDNCGNTVYFKARREETNNCQPVDHFYDQVKFCCEDIGDTVKVILRVYDVPVPAGPVTLDFEEEHSNECLVQVYIDDKIKPTCTAPAHVTVSCENFDPSLWAYGAPTGTDNCCVDTILVNANYQQFDTLCNKGTITRSFRVFDCGGLSNQCTQRIIVEYKQDYYIRFPHDWIATSCDGTGNWGVPEFFGQDCELLGVSYKDEVFTVVPDACFKIERSWTIINWCTFDPNKPCIFVPNPNPNAISNHPSNLVGAVVSPAGTPAPWAPTNVKISPTDPAPTNYSTFWDPNANCYKYKQIIKVIDTQRPVVECPDSTVQVCDLTSNDNLLWNAPHWTDVLTGSHDLCEAPTDLCITATDACSDTNITARYLLFLDLDNNGTMETVISSTNPPDPNVIPFGNAGNPNYSGGTPLAFDGRPVPLNQKYRFSLQSTVSGSNVLFCLRWNTQQQPDNFVLPDLPYGTHKIKWFVMDGCGNEQVCEYTFVVKDCKPPTLTCINGLSTNIMPTGSITLGTIFFIQNSYDNCTPTNLLLYGMRSSGNGGGFPYKPDGTPMTTFTYTCADLGFNLVEIWAMDLAGNSDFCTTYIKIQDNFGICGATNATVAGSILTENGLGVEDVNVQVQSSAPPGGQAPASWLGMSDDAGTFIIPNALPPASNAIVTPVKDNDPLNGVSTYDLVLINKHILGLAPLNSPYKMIAADANNSRSITTLDIVELRKLILGIYTELPEISSWRFVDKNYVFPNPYNPFQEIFPETKELTEVQAPMLTEDFIAVKTGDVNGNVVASSLLFVDERTDGMLLFDVEDRLLAPGEEFSVDLKAAEAVLGYQFTLYFPGLELLEVQPGSSMSADYFGNFPEEQALTTSFNGLDKPVTAEFSLRFRAEAGGKLSQLLSVSSRLTRAEAYRQLGSGADPISDMLDVGLRFSNEGTATITGVGFELYQNQPNPWTNTTRIGFHLPEPTDATLSIFAESGRVLYTQKGAYGRGYNSVSIDNKLLSGYGLLYYQLESDRDRAVKKMILLSQR